MYGHITFRTGDGVAHIRLNRPDRMNTLGIGPGSSREEIADAMRVADADDSAGCILLTAEGRAFCAGGDLSGAEPAETAYDEFRFLCTLRSWLSQWSIEDSQADATACAAQLLLN